MERVVLICALGVSPLWASQGLAQESGEPGLRSVRSLRNRAMTSYENGDYALCAKLFEDAAQLGSGEAAMNDRYNAACCRGRSGQLDKAFAALEQAVDAGYHNVRGYPTTPSARIWGIARSRVTLENKRFSNVPTYTLRHKLWFWDSL